MLIFLFFSFSFGPRESKKAMMYSNSGRLNCNVSYTTFASPVRGQVNHLLFCDDVLSFPASSLPPSLATYVVETYAAFGPDSGN